MIFDVKVPGGSNTHSGLKKGGNRATNNNVFLRDAKSLLRFRGRNVKKNNNNNKI